jgi:hypothetical protein
MAGEIATLSLGFIPDCLIMPQLEGSSGIAINCQETPLLQIDPEFRDLIPPLIHDELEILKESLSTERCCRDRLVVWKGHDILLDGHHRYEICRELGISFETREIELPSRADAKIWIIKNQRGRRNLNESQRSILAVKLEAIYSEKAKENMGTRTDLGLKLSQGEGGRSAGKAARELSVSRTSVNFAKKVVNKGIPKLPEYVESGDIAVSAAAKIASLPKEAQEKVVQVIETQIKSGKKPKIVIAKGELKSTSQGAPSEDADTRIEKFRKDLIANLDLLQGIESIQRPEILVEMRKIAGKIIARLKEIETQSLGLSAGGTITTKKEVRNSALVDKGEKKPALAQILDYYDYRFLSLLRHWQPIGYKPFLNRFKKGGWSEEEVGLRITKLINLNLINKEKYKRDFRGIREIKVRKLKRNPFLSLTETGKDEVKRQGDTFLSRFEGH